MQSEPELIVDIAPVFSIAQLVEQHEGTYVTISDVKVGNGLSVSVCIREYELPLCQALWVLCGEGGDYVYNGRYAPSRVENVTSAASTIPRTEGG